MIFIISYDITENRIRTKVAKYLIQQGGTRLQYSVFAIQKDWRPMKNIQQRLHQLLQQHNPHFSKDKIMIIRINKNSFNNMWTTGHLFEPKLITGSKNDLVFL